MVMKRVDNLEVSPPKVSVSEQQERLYRKFPHRTAFLKPQLKLSSSFKPQLSLSSARATLLLQLAISLGIQQARLRIISIGGVDLE